MVSYIDDHKKVFGVEPICRVLSEHGMPIASSTYYEASGRAPSRQAGRDEQLRVEVARVHRANFSVYGARKVWLQLNREHIPIAHCTVRRLMHELDLSGARRGKKKRTTFADPQAARAGDLVNRKFNPAAPNVLWVADFSYVSTWSGWVYVAFVIDAYSRRIVGWRTATTMNTALVLNAIEHAMWTRSREGITDLTGLIHHNDRGSQYTSITFTERLLDASIGATGDSYDTQSTMVFLAAPVTRTVARIDMPSTRQLMIRARSSVLSRLLILTIMLDRSRKCSSLGHTKQRAARTARGPLF